MQAEELDVRAYLSARGQPTRSIGLRVSGAADWACVLQEGSRRKGRDLGDERKECGVYAIPHSNGRQGLGLSGANRRDEVPLPLDP
jgi:hypothetical protein